MTVVKSVLLMRLRRRNELVRIQRDSLGGEGWFFAALRGPGKVWLQSLPFSRLAGRMLAAAPQKGGSREEGSVLGAGVLGAGLLGGLFGGNEDDE